MKAKRFLSLLLTMVMVIGVLTAGSLSTFASDTGTTVQAGTASEVNIVRSVARSVSYVQTYTGTNGWVQLTQSGNYLLNGATFDASSRAGYSGLDIGNASTGINAVLYISGTVTVIAGD